MIKGWGKMTKFICFKGAYSQYGVIIDLYLVVWVSEAVQ